MLYIALVLIVLAIIVLWQSSRQRKQAGLPGGRVIYTDTRAWGRVEQPLTVDMTMDVSLPKWGSR